MSKAKAVKSVKLKPFEKVLNILISGKPTSKDEINALIGSEIQMYRISTYMWHCKTIAGCIIKVVKDGRRVTGYQLVNVDTAKEYLETMGVLQAQTEKVETLAELGADVVQSDATVKAPDAAEAV